MVCHCMQYKIRPFPRLKLAFSMQTSQTNFSSIFPHPCTCGPLFLLAPLWAWVAVCGVTQETGRGNQCEWKGIQKTKMVVFQQDQLPNRFHSTVPRRAVLAQCGKWCKGRTRWPRLPPLLTRKMQPKLLLRCSHDLFPMACLQGLLQCKVSPSMT